MRTRFHAGLAFAFCACVTGCAVPGASPVTTAAVTANTFSASGAKDAITIGKSTKADVSAALGKATVISFDSGFEVWVYQVGGDAPAKLKTEFVVLFAPSGVVTKTRIRTAPPMRRST